MPLLSNIKKLYSCRSAETVSIAQGRLKDVIDDAALVWEEDRICWVGARADLPSRYSAYENFDAAGAVVVPGLIDCHTHLLFGGWRTDDYLARLAGGKYAHSHGSDGQSKGVMTTVEATRRASSEELLVRGAGFCDAMLDLGVTTIEVKSGYGLNAESELKVLRAIKELGRRVDLDIVSTFLGAHFVPPEFKESPDGYVDMLCSVILPRVADENLADFCDVFVEEIAFSPAEGREILKKARELGLKLKIHADQLGDSGGGRLAAELQVVSADHLEYSAPEVVRAMSDSHVIGVLLPLASWYLKDKWADGAGMIAAGMQVAVATDFNPGSAPSFHLPLALSMSCLNCGLTPEQALFGATYNAARALSIERSHGSIEVGKKADFVLLDAESVDHWIYHFKPNAAVGVFKAGVPVRGGNNE